jgi:uncharacterized protein (TIGR03086 family)
MKEAVMDPIDELEQAWAQGSQLLAALRASDLEAPTPCVGCDVRTLINHVLGEALMMTEANNGAAGSNERGDLVGSGDAHAIWQSIGQDNVASWREHGLQGDRTYVYGTFPATLGVVINLGEVLVHNWDLAQATGQACRLDPELSASVFGLYSAMPLEHLRADGVFGPEIPVPEDAPIADRLLGLLGRRPTSPNGSVAPAIARAVESETLHLGSGTMQLLLDAPATGGALSAHRVQLSEGQVGANPHTHACTSELFFVLDGSIDVLAGGDVLTATTGDLVVVPPGNPHAFAASAERSADVLVMVTPGTERFEFFRALSRAMAPGADPAERLRVTSGQNGDDARPAESAAWSNR